MNLIKVIGLSLGFCGVLCIALFIKNELSYDTGYSQSDYMHRLTITSPDFAKGNHFARIFNSKQIPEVVGQIPEIANAVRLAPLRDKLILKQEQYYRIDQAFAVDKSFLDVFDVPLLKGDSSTVLGAPGTAVISRSLAEKIFGNENAIGQTISLPPGHFNTIETNFTITGIMADFEQQRHLHPEVLIMPGEDEVSGWAYVYLLLKKNTTANKVVQKISQKLNEINTTATGDLPKMQAHMMPVDDIHLKSNLLREIEPNGNMTNIHVLAIAACILLFISLSNFASLNLGMLGYLNKFLSLNQILGSPRAIGIRYFTIECSIIALTAMVVVVAMSFQLNGVVLETYGIDFFQGNGWFIMGLLTAFYLAAILAGVQPVLKNRFSNLVLARSIKGEGSIKGHKIILVSQFAMAIILLVGVFVITKQTDYALNKGMGADEDNVVCIPYVHSEIQKDFAVFKSSLMEQSAIMSVSSIMAPPGGETNDMFAFTMHDFPDIKEEYIGVFACDYSFLEVFDLPFLSGKNFTENNSDADGNGEYIINETALRYLGFQDANTVIDKDFALISPVEGITLPEGKIIGVIKDLEVSR